MSKSFRNPEFSDDDRRTHIKQRIKEETAKAVNTWETTGWGSRERRARLYLQTIRPTDHVTYRIAVFVLFHDDEKLTSLDPYPEKYSLEWYRLKDYLREKLPILINVLRNEPKKFLSLVTGMEEDPRTKDRELIIINAKTHERKEDARLAEQWSKDWNKSANKKRAIGRKMMTIARMEPKKRKLELRKYIDDYF